MSYVKYYNELYHYGVKGMKWGVRKKYKPAGGKRAKKKQPNESEQNKRKGLTDKQKRAIKIGAVAAGTVLAVYGAYKIRDLYTGGKSPIDPVTGFRLLTKDMSTQEHLNKINPGRIRMFPGRAKNTVIIKGSETNCMLCTTAYELRKRGFDVHANLAPPQGYTPENLFPHIFKDYKGVTEIKASVSDAIERNTDGLMRNLIDTLKKEGMGARGNIMVAWNSGFGEHSMIWENINGEIKFMDGQTGVIYKNFEKEVLKRVDFNKPLQYLRTDNLEVNPKELFKYVDSDTTLKTYVDNAEYIITDKITDAIYDPYFIPIAAMNAATAAGAYVAYRAIKNENQKEKDSKRKEEKKYAK